MTGRLPKWLRAWRLKVNPRLARVRLRQSARLRKLNPGLVARMAIEDARADREW